MSEQPTEIIEKTCKQPDCENKFWVAPDGPDECGQCVDVKPSEPEPEAEPKADAPEAEPVTRASSEFKERLDPGGHHLPSVRTPEEILAEANAAKKNRWLAIFIQLSRCERFLKFVEGNYVIRDAINDDTKTIETQVFENPRAVGPPMTKAQAAKIYTTLKMYGTRKPEKVFKAIMETLGQPTDTPSIITSASKEDIARAAEQAGLKDKLD